MKLKTKDYSYINELLFLLNVGIWEIYLVANEVYLCVCDQVGNYDAWNAQGEISITIIWSATLWDTNKVIRE